MPIEVVIFWETVLPTLLPHLPVYEVSRNFLAPGAPPLKLIASVRKAAGKNAPWTPLRSVWNNISPWKLSFENRDHAHQLLEVFFRFPITIWSRSKQCEEFDAIPYVLRAINLAYVHAQHNAPAPVLRGNDAGACFTPVVTACFVFAANHFILSKFDDLTLFRGSLHEFSVSRNIRGVAVAILGSCRLMSSRNTLRSSRATGLSWQFLGTILCAPSI